MAQCSDKIIKLRQGDDSNYNCNHIVFHLKTSIDLTNWKATFQLQDLQWSFDSLASKRIDLIINREQSLQLEVGTCYGYLQLIDSEDKYGTIYGQKFQILPLKVHHTIL